jgi:hypothetical protein
MAVQLDRIELSEIKRYAPATCGAAGPIMSTAQRGNRRPVI